LASRKTGDYEAIEFFPTEDVPEPQRPATRLGPVLARARDFSRGIQSDLESLVKASQ